MMNEFCQVQSQMAENVESLGKVVKTIRLATSATSQLLAVLEGGFEFNGGSCDLLQLLWLVDANVKENINSLSVF